MQLLQLQAPAAHTVSHVVLIGLGQFFQAQLADLQQRLGIAA